MGRRRPGRPSPQAPRTLHGTHPEEELDLHGLTGAEAEFRVRAFVARWARTHPGTVVRIITGKGKGSSGAPVLRALVLELLTDDLASSVADWAGEHGGGSFLVRVR